MTTLTDGLAAYSICARAEGKSPKTIRHVFQSITFFGAFLGSNSDITAITASDFRRFIIALQSKNKYTNHPYNKPQQHKLSPHTIATYCRGIKSFYAYLCREELIEENPLKKVKIPRASNQVVPTFSERQLEKLLEQPDRSKSIGFRDFAVMLTFADTSIRLNELAGLKLNDVDFDNGYLRVMGKGAKERYVPFGQKVAKVLLKYKLKYRPEPLANDYFWLANSGRPLTADRIEKMITHYGEKAGLERCYAHKLRHTSAVIYLRNGGDPFSLQKKLGHASLAMTRHYSNLADADVRTRHLRYGVVDRLRI